MIVDKYGNNVRKFMWQLCGWDMSVHNRKFDFFFISLHVDLTILKKRDYELSKKCQLYPTYTVAT
jgi:hypothetical protein